VTAARRVLYEQGVDKATLAGLAAAAEVPLGNVYYYFRTKDALVAAVIDGYRDSYDALSAELDQHQRPADRLKALVRLLAARQEMFARHGCPIGTLGSELGKEEAARHNGHIDILRELADGRTGR
jgi:TetR/AcrR family transcriptional regulator, transcriptional repressor for nem operon